MADGNEPGDFLVAVELESEDPVGNRGGRKAGSTDDDYYDHTSGRHRQQRVVLWRGEDSLNQASIALGRQIDVIASQVTAQLSHEAESPGLVVDSVELNFGVKIVADAGKVWGVFTVSHERAVQVKVTLKRSPPA